MLLNIKIAAIGATTAKKVAENNLKVEFVSPKASAEDFAFGLIDFIKNKKH
jgi:uroporphyrinogen-III synthase